MTRATEGTKEMKERMSHGGKTLTNKQRPLGNQMDGGLVEDVSSSHSGDVDVSAERVNITSH